MSTPADQALVETTPPGEEIELAAVPEQLVSKATILDGLWHYPSSFSFSSSMPTSMHTLNSTGNWSIACSFSILEFTTVWVGLIYSWLMIPIWVAKARKQQRCVITQGLKDACISDRRFGREECIGPTFMADIVAATQSHPN